MYERFGLVLICLYPGYEKIALQHGRACLYLLLPGIQLHLGYHAVLRRNYITWGFVVLYLRCRHAFTHLHGRIRAVQIDNRKRQITVKYF